MPVSVVEEDKQTISSAVCTSHMKHRQLLKHLTIHPSMLLHNPAHFRTSQMPTKKRLTLPGPLLKQFLLFKDCFEAFLVTFHIINMNSESKSIFISYRRLIFAIQNEVFILWHQKWDELYSHLITCSWSSVRSLNKLWKSLKSAQAWKSNPLRLTT